MDTETISSLISNLQLLYDTEKKKYKENNENKKNNNNLLINNF